MIQSAAASRPQPRLTRELSVTLGHHYTSQPKWPKTIRNVPTVNCSNKNPSFWLSSNTGLRLTCLHRCAPASSCHRLHLLSACKQPRFPPCRRLRLRTVTALRSSMTSLSSSVGLNRCRGPHFVNSLWLQDSRTGCSTGSPGSQFLFVMCEVMHINYSGQRVLMNSSCTLPHVGFDCFFSFLFYDSCSDLIHCTTTITTKTCF